MKRELILSGSIANAGREVSGRELIEFLASEMPDAEFYQFRPPPGRIMAAGLDWQAILGTTASVLAIGQAIWAAYKKFIIPIRQKNNNSTADLFIYIKTEENKSEQFMIGKSFKDENDFMQGFQESIIKLEHSHSNGEELKITKQELRMSEYWVRIKKSS